MRKPWLLLCGCFAFALAGYAYAQSRQAVLPDGTTFNAKTRFARWESIAVKAGTPCDLRANVGPIVVGDQILQCIEGPRERERAK